MDYSSFILKVGSLQARSLSEEQMERLSLTEEQCEILGLVPGQNVSLSELSLIALNGEQACRM